MVNIVKMSKHKSILSDLAYTALNVGLAVALLIIVLAIKSPLPALGIVLLSKWRMVAVRPRFWFKNIQSNLVDIIVGFSVVVFLYAESNSLPVQVLITTLYALWLLFVKPRSKRIFVFLQAGVALFIGTNALFMVAFDWPLVAVVLAMWLIGYASARHVLTHYREKELTFFSMIWALVVAELGWLGFHWAFAYDLPAFSGIDLSQTAVITLVLGFLATMAYDSYHQNEGVIKWNDVMLPTFFSVSIIVVILVFFNTIGTGII